MFQQSYFDHNVLKHQLPTYRCADIELPKGSVTSIKSNGSKNRDSP